ncbi:hypothetical protein [Planomonospora algeriensis]
MLVLVHGAFADASSWNGVIERLQRRGYTVIASANPLRFMAERAGVRRAGRPEMDAIYYRASYNCCTYNNHVMPQEAE